MKPRRIELRLGPRSARVSRWCNFVLGLLTLQWRWKQEGEPLPGGGRRFVVDQEVVWTGRIVLVVALTGSLLAFWWLA
jgi:hypothetical protein